MKHSTTSFDSFQDELEDYIKVQKARGLEPKTCFRTMRQDYLESRGRREVHSRPRHPVCGQRLPAGARLAYPRPCSLPQTAAAAPPPAWLPPHHSGLQPATPSPCPPRRDCFPGPLGLGRQEEARGRHRQDPHGSWHPEAGGGEAEQGRPKHKRRRSAEGTPRKGSPGELAPRKERRARAEASRKEDRRQRRKEKKEEAPARTEEEMLWDQSILGF